MSAGGKLAFYVNNGNFETKYSKHSGCLLTRTSKRGPRSNGRPVGKQDLSRLLQLVSGCAGPSWTKSGSLILCKLF